MIMNKGVNLLLFMEKCDAVFVSIRYMPSPSSSKVCFFSNLLYHRAVLYLWDIIGLSMEASDRGFDELNVSALSRLMTYYGNVNIAYGCKPRI